MGALGIFVVLAWVLGLVLRRRLANLNRLFNREIVATDLLIGEDVQVIGRGYRLSDVIHALSDRSDFRSRLDRRSRHFTERYPTLLRVALLTGLGGMVVLGLIAWLVHEQSATLLFLWMLWCLVVIAFLVVLEYVNHSFEAAEIETDPFVVSVMQAFPGAEILSIRNIPLPDAPDAEALEDEDDE